MLFVSSLFLLDGSTPDAHSSNITTPIFSIHHDAFRSTGLRGRAGGGRIAIAAKPARASVTRPCIRGALTQPTASDPAPPAQVPEVAALRALPTKFQVSPDSSSFVPSAPLSSPAGGGAATRGGRYLIYRPGWTVFHLPSIPGAR
ncbi:hypothetical protein C2845_PM12G24880 [Panicum miliaceum]|uniref:Uncharacterized protein n=1 Tax=Panicum miliaceum TaxID=4540 RepID=A0A3L6QGA5_PANMI|nr:hypothetical protein C2845_PM12G24880 [Panicum miliaceum]